VLYDYSNHPRRGILIKDIPAPLALVTALAAGGFRVIVATASGAISIGIDWPLSLSLVEIKYLSCFHVTLDSTMFPGAIQGMR